MADNIEITPGTGATVATEDVSGVHHQQVLLEAYQPDFSDDIQRLMCLYADDGGAALQVAPRRMLYKSTHNLTTAQTYPDGDCIGGEVSNVFAGSFESNQGHLMVETITLLDRTGTGPDLDVLVYGDAGSPTLTATDGGAFAPTAAEIATAFVTNKGVIERIPDTAWLTMGSAKLVQVHVGRPLSNWFSTLRAAVVNRSGSNYVAAGTTDLQLGIDLYAL